MLFRKQSPRRGSEHPAIRSACKYAVERLEDRLLLSTGTELAQDKAAAIRDGISDLASFADKLETFGGFAKQIPVIGKSVGQVLDLGNTFRTNVLAPVQSLLATDLTPTPDQIKGAIQTVLDALPTSGDTVTVVQDGNEIRFDIQFVAGQTTTVPLNLGDNSAGFGFKASADVKGQLNAQFSFGVDLTDGLAPQEAFFVDLNGPAGTSTGLKASASLDLKDFQLGGKLGVVDVQLGDGAGGAAETLKASAELGIGFKDAPDGRKTVSDLLNSTPSALVNVTTGPATGALSASIPLKATIGGFTGTTTLVLSDDNLLDAVAPTVTLTGGNVADLQNFKNLSPAAVVGLIQQIGASVQNVAKGLNPSGGIPFVGDALNQAVNFSDMVTGMTLGLFDVNLAGSSSYTATNAFTGTLSKDAKFTLSIVDTTIADTSAQVVATKEFTIPAGAYTLASLEAAIKGQFTAAFAGKADVKDDGSRIRFEAIGAGRTVTLRFAADSAGMRDMGFEPSLTNAVFKFDSVQSLAPLLAQAMGIAESALGLNYNATTKALEVNLKFNRAFTKSLDLNFNDTVDLGVGKLALSGGIGATVSATANLDVTLGMKFDPTLVTFPGSYGGSVFPIYLKDGGKVSATAAFQGTGDLSAGLGILELGIDGATANFNVGGSFTLKDPTPGDGGVLAGEFLTPGVINAPTFTAGGSVTLPLAVSGGADVGVNAPAGAKVVLNFLSSPTVKLSPDVSGVSDFIKQFTNFSTENVFAVLKQLVGFIQNSDIKLFNEPLPLVGKSIKDLLAFADGLVSGLDDKLAAVKNLKSVFFNGGATTKAAIQAVRDAITTALVSKLQTLGGDAQAAGVRLQQAKDQLTAALGSLSADVQLSANLVSAMGLVVQSVAQLNSVPGLPSDVTTALGGLDTAMGPIRDVLPKIQSLKDVIGGTSILNALNNLGGEGPELANRLLEAVDRLDEALSQLPDSISDGAAFRLPVAITSTMAELSRTLDKIGALPGLPAPVSDAVAQAKAALGPIQQALPAVQRLVGFLIDALNIKSLITSDMITTIQNQVVQGLTDAINGLTDAAAKAALQAVKDKINEALAAGQSLGPIDPQKVDLVKLLSAFDDLKKALDQFQSGPLKDNDPNNNNEPGDFVRNALVDLAKSLPGRPTVSLDGDDLNIGFEFELSKELKDFKLDFSLKEGPDVIPLEIKTDGTVNLSIGALLDINFGVDLGMIGADPTKVLDAVFFRDTTKLNLNAFAAVDDFHASAGIGGIDLVELGPTGNPGSFAFKKDITDPASKDAASIELKLVDNSDGNADGKIALSSFSFSNFDLSSTGQLELSVPIKIGSALVTLDDGTTVDPLKITLSDLTDFSTLNFHIPENLDEALAKGLLNIDFLIQGLVKFLDKISHGLVSDVLAKLPLIGNVIDFGDSALGQLTKPSTGSSLTADPTKGFIDNLKDELDGFSLKAANQVQEFLQKLFFKLLGPGDAGFTGLNILVLDPTHFDSNTDGDNNPNTNPDTVADFHDVDIKVNGDLDSPSNSSIEAHLKLGKEHDHLLGTDFDLGFDGLGLVGFKLDGGVAIDLGYTIDLGFKIDKQNGFSLLLNNDPNDPEAQFTAEVGLTDGTELSANLFFLQLQGTNGDFNHDGKRTGLSGTIGLDLQSPNATVPITDIGSISFVPTYNVSAQIDMALTTGFGLGTSGPNKNLPNISTNLLVNWVIAGSDPQNVSDKPHVELNDITLDVGQFVGTVLAPLIDALQGFLKPIQPLLDIINTEIPVISQVSQLVGQGPVTFADAISALGKGGDTIAKVVAILTRIKSLVDLLETVGGQSAAIKFGDLHFDDVGGFDIRKNSAADKINDLLAKFQSVFNLDDAGQAGSVIKDLSGQGGQSLAGGAAGGALEGLSFPIFTNPAEILQLMFGKDINLVTWDLPRLDASFEFSQLFGPIIPPFPVFAKIGGAFGIFAHFSLGLDTRGLRTGNFLNGIFFNDRPFGAPGTDDQPELGIFMEFKAGAELNIAFAKAGVEGSIRADINADWNDPDHDGKIHLDELIANFQRGLQCVFDLSGALTAALGAYLNIEIPLGFTSITIVDVSFDIFRATLFDFSITCPPLPPPVPATQVGSELLLNIGDRAGFRQPGATDIDESIKIYGERDLNGDGKIDVPLKDLNGDGKIGEDELAVAEDFDGDGHFTPGTVAVVGFAVVQVNTGVTKITGNGGAGDDEIILDPSVQVAANLRGGDGDDTIQGGSANDTIAGEGGADQINGGAGNDVLHGGDANDKIRGGAGADTITGDDGDDDLTGGLGDGKDAGDGDDNISGGAGNDRISGNLGNDVLDGGDGTDNLDGGDGNDALYGRADNDSLFGGAGNDYMEGGRGDDQLTGGDGNDSMVGGSSNAADPDTFGNDILKGEGGDDVLTGDDAIIDDVTLIGGVGRDTLIGGDGNDEIYGQGGVDILIGDEGTVDPGSNAVTLTDSAAPGSDSLFGGADGDSMYGEAGNDTMLGEAGDDRMFGGVGNDTMRGGNDQDLILGEDGNDSIFGDAGNDTVEAGDGADTVFGGTGNDRLLGQEANDSLEGNGGSDTIFGGAGNDSIIGGSSGATDLAAQDDAGDSIVGDSGDDVILGDNGTISATGDVVTNASGGAGSDTIFGSVGNDVIFGGGAGDSLVGDAASGSGDDIIVGDQGTRNASGIVALHSTVAGSSGNDTISGAGGSDTILGGDGNDSIDGDSAATSGQDIILGDNGKVSLVGGVVTRIETTEVAFGGNDTITGGNLDDVILGGSGSDQIDGGADAGNDILLGDNGVVVRADGSPQANDIFSNDTTGAPDTVLGGDGNDTILGGTAGDSLVGGNGNDVILGDHGLVQRNASNVVELIQTTFEDNGGNDTITAGAGNDIAMGGFASDQITGDDGNDILLGDNGLIDYVFVDHDPTTIDIITVTMPNLGAPDTISGGANDDSIMGGTAGDSLDGNGGNDLIFGDHGKIEPLKPKNVNFTSIFTGAGDGGGSDTIQGNAGDDTVLGGQAGDLIYGNEDDDDLVGGHNVAGGADAGDTMDGGAGRDVIAGDNAVITRRSDTVSQTVRTLGGTAMYNADGSANITGGPRANPNGAPGRDVTLLDHSKTTAGGLFGNDLIAGGAGDDSIFGQLGDDTIQGDSTSALNPFATRQSIEAATDGNDYIEGNGGSDLIFGDLGQDDIVGGSSDLFGLTTADMRPDGADVIFGGAGLRIARNDAGDTTAGGHGRDADLILGDNGDVYRLVGIYGTPTSQFLKFNYDNYDLPGGIRLIPRVMSLLDYTAGIGAATDNGAADLIHGEAGDDTVHGMTGNDVLFGEGQDDDVYGGAGHDRIYGGTGEDGLVGDDGKILTSRNGTTEPLNSLDVANAQTAISLPGPFVGTVEFITGRLSKTVDLNPTGTGGNDVIYGGLGDDFIHAGAGDDAVSGAEALPAFYNELPVTNTNVLGYDPVTGKLAAYDANHPMTKIAGFLLNFDAVDGTGAKINDGKDRIFGDDGNDWLVGGTQNDRLFGGFGDDLMNLDDNQDTAGGLNNVPDAPQFADRDFAFGGGGLDVLIANTGGDRMFDWGGEFNSYLVPFSAFGEPTVFRNPSPHVRQFLLDLGRGSGADQTLTEPLGELAIVTSKDPQWHDQHGGPRDPQAGNTPGTHRDTQGGPEDDSATGGAAVNSASMTTGNTNGHGHKHGTLGDSTLADAYYDTDPSDPTKLALYVGGTAGNDVITVNPGATAGTVVVTVNGASRTFTLTNADGVISRVIVYGQDGNDRITVASYLALPSFLYGGYGDDTLQGGAGINVLDGGDGNDQLLGGDGVDLMVGGAGLDNLDGGKGDDILIGGIYLQSEDVDVVTQLLAEWTRPVSLAQRINDLMGVVPPGAGALNGDVFFVPSVNVLNDGAKDVLYGRQGSDWFFGSSSDTNDSRQDDLLTSV